LIRFFNHRALLRVPFEKTTQATQIPKAASPSFAFGQPDSPRIILPFRRWTTIYPQHVKSLGEPAGIVFDAISSSPMS